MTGRSERSRSEALEDLAKYNYSALKGKLEEVQVWYVE